MPCSNTTAAQIYFFQFLASSKNPLHLFVTNVPTVAQIQDFQCWCISHNAWDVSAYVEKSGWKWLHSVCFISNKSKKGTVELLVTYQKSDLGFGKVIPSCMSYMRLAQRCPRALSSHSQVPIPRAQRVADRVHLTTSFPPRRLELATRRSAVRRVTDRATREGFSRT